MVCCGRVSKNKNTIVPENEIVESYVEGVDGFVEIEYLQADLLRVKGCESGHIYLFSDFVQTVIDANDASCLFDRYPGLFNEVVKIGTQSGYSESELESPFNKSADSTGDGQVHEISE